MFINLKKRLELLKSIRAQIDNGEIVFDETKPNFGFKRLDQLFPVICQEVKGYPCLAFNKLSDKLKYGVKIIPQDNNFSKESHPSEIELNLLQEFTKLIDSLVTPHITYYLSRKKVPNSRKALIDFPLKPLKKNIYNDSHILVSEFVPGGSIEEWIQEEVNITEKQWKYIVFSVAWTLLVLGDRYKFIHSDFHYGNILIDSSVNPSNRTLYRYTLKDSNNKQLVFNVANVGIIPKMWDFEYASTFKETPDLKIQNNGYFEEEENVPHEYNPYYDLHSFFHSIKELNIPKNLEDFIDSIYSKEALEFTGHKKFASPSTASTCSTSSTNSRNTDSLESCCSKDSCDCGEYSINSANYHEYFYKTDEEMSDDEQYYNKNNDSTDSESDSEKGHSNNESSKNDTNDETKRSSNSSCSSRSSGSSDSSEEERSEFLLEGRLINGAEQKLKLPTPMDILTHEYFASYRKQNKTDPLINFEYHLTEQVLE